VKLVHSIWHDAPHPSPPTRLPSSHSLNDPSVRFPSPQFAWQLSPAPPRKALQDQAALDQGTKKEFQYDSCLLQNLVDYTSDEKRQRLDPMKIELLDYKYDLLQYYHGNSSENKTDENGTTLTYFYCLTCSDCCTILCFNFFF
jgi:hypothetical protein